mmetsp:Transcript_27731/g.71989  ORF Transcript_27731/g.71989 Transcript_27731/m.71989 type:complete len:400 (-) Transcript_27731:413-1612(-)
MGYLQTKAHVSGLGASVGQAAGWGCSLRRAAACAAGSPVAAMNIREYRRVVPACPARGGTITTSRISTEIPRTTPVQLPRLPAASSATSRADRPHWCGSLSGRAAGEVGGKLALRAFRSDTSSTASTTGAVDTPLAQAARRVGSLPKSAVNLGVMVAFLGSLAEQFVTVDSAKWSGWSVWDILAHMPADNLRVYQDCLDHHPLWTAMLVTGATYYFADWTAQTCEGNKLMEFDAARLLRSTVLGLLVFGPLVQTYYQFQADLFHGWFPAEPWYSEVLKILMDQTCFCFTYNMLYYIGDGGLKGRPLGASLSEFRAVWWKLQTAGWKFWPFVGLFTHTVIPLQHKVLFVDMAEVVWVTYLSLTANAEKEASGRDAPPGESKPGEGGCPSEADMEKSGARV